MKEQQLQRSSKSGNRDGYGVRRSGDATVVLVGYPSVGKSTLLNRLTNADSPVGAYEFTTLKVVPGIMEYRGARIQLLDLPGLVHGASRGRGRGREVLSMVRNADMVVIVVDVFHPEVVEVLRRELYDAGIRLDENPPDVSVKRTERGGVLFSSTVELPVSEDEMRAVLSEYKIHNALVLIREAITLDSFIDVLLGNRVYVPSLTVMNKSDLPGVKHVNMPEAIHISAETGEGLDELRLAIYSRLKFIEIYMKRQGARTDYEEPLVVREGTTVGEVCDWIHMDFRQRFRYARVWGPSARHEGQRVGLEHVLENGDVLSIIVRK